MRSVAVTLSDRRALMALAPLVLLAAVAGALLALSDVRAAYFGEPAPTVSGYAVAEIRYTLAADPSQIASVAFRITPYSAQERIDSVQVRLVSSSAATARCTNAPAGTPRWECPLGGVALAAADQLKVIVVAPPDYPNNPVWLPIVRR